MKVVILKEKHGDRYIKVPELSPTHRAAKKPWYVVFYALLGQRLGSGHWYFDEDKQKAQKAYDGGVMSAGRFIEGSHRWEYEDYDIQDLEELC